MMTLLAQHLHLERVGPHEAMLLSSPQPMGTASAAYAAHPEREASAQIAILGDANGLGLFYKELALRLAEVGIAAVAIDYYGRTAGLGARDASFDPMLHSNQMKFRFPAQCSASLARPGTSFRSAMFQSFDESYR